MSSARESVKAGLVLRKNEPSESARSKALGTSIENSGYRGFIRLTIRAMRTKIEHGGLRINSLRPPSLRDTPGTLMPAKRRRDISTPTKLPIHCQQSLRRRQESPEVPVR
jgi:hypothetical protein